MSYEPQNETRILRFEDMQAEVEADAKALWEAREKGIPRGPVTGFPTLDRHIGGHLAPGVHIMHGEPGTGKSAWCQQVAANCGFPALYVTCEMAPLELNKRNAARVTRTPLNHFKTGEQKPMVQSAKMLDAARQVSNLVIMDATVAPALPLFIRDCAIIARGQAQHMLVVIDSLHSWVEGWAGEVTEYEGLNLGIKSLRTLSRQIGHPVLAIAERNRESMKSSGMSSGAGSRKIEYGAEVVYGMSHGGDNPGEPDEDGNFAVDIKITKNRHGAPGSKVHLIFTGKYQSFEERFARRY